MIIAAIRLGLWMMSLASLVLLMRFFRLDCGRASHTGSVSWQRSSGVADFVVC